MASLQDDPSANLLNDLFGRIADRDEIVHLGSPDVAPGNHCAADPVEEAVPEGTLVQDNGKRTDTFGLREHKRFGEFVNVPMPPGMTTYASAYFTNMSLRRKK